MTQTVSGPDAARWPPGRGRALLLRLVARSAAVLLVVLTPRTAGVAHLTGVTLDFRRGASHLFQHGTQDVAVDSTLTAR